MSTVSGSPAASASAWIVSAARSAGRPAGQEPAEGGASALSPYSTPSANVSNRSRCDQSTYTTAPPGVGRISARSQGDGPKLNATFDGWFCPGPECGRQAPVPPVGPDRQIVHPHLTERVPQFPQWADPGRVVAISRKVSPSRASAPSGSRGQGTPTRAR